MTEYETGRRRFHCLEEPEGEPGEPFSLCLSRYAAPVSPVPPLHPDAVPLGMGKPSDADCRTAFGDLEKSFSEAVLPWFNRFPSKQDTLKVLVNDLAQGYISMPVYIADRLVACGYGARLPILKSERFLQKNPRHKQKIIELIEQIERESLL